MMQALTGSIVALVTPMNSNGEVDFNALSDLIQWHIEEGTNGIVSVGTTGESATLSVREHIEVIEKTVNLVNGRIPVIAGTGSNSTAQAIETTSEAKRIGADACLLVTPYYNRPSQEGLIRHYTKIADSIDIPQILYNVPSRTACDLLPETVKVLSGHEKIIGIKESVKEVERIKELIDISNSVNKEFSILSGDDSSFFTLMKEGGHGVISVAANVIPKAISEICLLINNEKLDQAIDLNRKNETLYKLLFVESNPVPAKWMLCKMNKIQDFVRLPLVELNEEFHENIISEMLKLKLI